jgi:hypothetical protein
MNDQPTPTRLIDKLLWPILTRFWATIMVMLGVFVPVITVTLLMPIGIAALIVVPVYIGLFWIMMVAVDGSQGRLNDAELDLARRKASGDGVPTGEDIASAVTIMLRRRKP